ncbi:MAG: hypothetical protein E4H20_10280, partial [Spirochaetales bacterium]
MIPFVIHAAFLAGWDAMIILAMLNAAILVPTVAFVLVPTIAGAPVWLGFAGLGLWMLMAVIWWSVCVYALKGVDSGDSPSVASMLAATRSALVPGLQLVFFGLLPVLALLFGALV